MSVRNRLLRRHKVPYRQAFSHAITQLNAGVYTKTRGIQGWLGARLGRPTVVYDLNDQPLFYDFPVFSRRRQNLGLIRSSANRVLGVPVPSINIGRVPWDVRAATEKAIEIVRRKFRGKVVGTKIVCYAYPKLGVAVDWEERSREHQRTIIDIGDFSIVPERVEPGMRGPGAWSFYGQIKEEQVQESVRHFEQYSRLKDEIQERSGVSLARNLKLTEAKTVQSNLLTILPAFTTKILTFCTHGYSHECFRMHGQENSVWCVVATGQMILDFWRYYNSQSNIATAMGTGSGGTGWTGEVNGLNSLTCSHFNAQSDMSPTFAKVKTEINANRPFDYSYSYHAMACAGYRQQNWYIFGTTPEQSVYLYDPWPPNVGTIRWETWGAGVSPVAGFVYLRR